jgi:hypothetical protein
MPGMPTFSTKRMMASVTLIAAACGAFTLVRAGMNYDFPWPQLSLFAYFAIGPLCGAGIGNLWKKAEAGAGIGFLIQFVISFFLLLPRVNT